MKIIECVPNISEGQNQQVIDVLIEELEKYPSIKLLHTDKGYAANRTVFTFAGEAEAMLEATFAFIKKATEVIDMRLHKGEHPRIGAVDVCPFIPIANISLTETVVYAHRLAKRVAEELKIPVYCYEDAALIPERSKLEYIRAGEYEKLAEKLKNPAFKPDFGTAIFNAKTGACIIGARKILVAYNVNLATKSVKIAKDIAAEVRESGKTTLIDGKKTTVPGTCKSVKAIGWYIKEYDLVQVSLNITDLDTCSVHAAFEEVCRVAEKYGTYVRGSELIGLAPLRVFREAADFYKQYIKLKERKLTDEEAINLATSSLGLDDIDPNFNPFERVLEFLIK
jgi:glutamate formiminotransferase/formiminotetrahydrofolate cyclodeaminase